MALAWRSHQLRQLGAKVAEHRDFLRCRLHDLCLRLEDRAALSLGQHAHDFPHAPARSAQDLESVHAGDQKGYAIVTDHTDALGVAVEGLELEAGQVDALELFGGIHGNQRGSARMTSSVFPSPM